MNKHDGNHKSYETQYKCYETYELQVHSMYTSYIVQMFLHTVFIYVSYGWKSLTEAVSVGD